MKEKLTALLQENFSEIDFTESDALWTTYFESMTLVEIIATIALELGITIPYEEVIPRTSTPSPPWRLCWKG